MWKKLVKKTIYDKLAPKVDGIEAKITSTAELQKSQYDHKIEKKNWRCS